jgi:hypothetical protein
MNQPKASCDEVDLLSIIDVESLLRRPAPEGSGSPQVRLEQERGRTLVRGEPLIRQALCEFGARGASRDGGLRAIDTGPLERARQLEGLGLLGITLQQPLGLNFQSAWKLIS